jgi:hypothetical protein
VREKRQNPLFFFICPLSHLSPPPTTTVSHQ